MSKKLGEILIERGVITAGQLDKALRNQLMLGGHLGTCLLELGFLAEEVLGRTLAEVTGVPYASPAVFGRIRGMAIRTLPAKVVEECRAVPLQRNGNELVVAMVNPRDLASRDALAFASGCRIVPWVAPEIRIFDAMDKFYGIARRQRYIAISQSRSPLELALTRSAGAKAADAPGHGIGAEPHGGSDEGFAAGDDSCFRDQRSWREIANELFPDDATPAKKTDVANPAAATPTTANPASAGPATMRPATAAPATAGPATASPATAGPATAGPATASPATVDQASAKPAPASPATASAASGPAIFARAAEKLCNANSPDDVARAVLDEVARVLPRVALFSVKDDDLRFWAGRGVGDSGASRSTVPFPVSSRGIFGHLAGEGSYCGPLRRDPDCLPFFDWLGIKPPAGILLVPVHLNDRLVALIYGDAEEQRRIEARNGDIERLSRMLGFALTAIIYKNKIRGIGALALEARTS